VHIHQPLAFGYCAYKRLSAPVSYAVGLFNPSNALGGRGAGGNGGPSYGDRLQGQLSGPSQRPDGNAGSACAKGIGGTAGNMKAPDGIAGSTAEEYGIPLAIFAAAGATGGGAGGLWNDVCWA